MTRISRQKKEVLLPVCIVLAIVEIARRNMRENIMIYRARWGLGGKKSLVKRQSKKLPELFGSVFVGPMGNSTMIFHFLYHGTLLYLLFFVGDIFYFV